jgi:phage terminase small subunit
VAGRPCFRLQQAIAEKDGEKILELITEKQRAFCYEYIKDFNATRAAIRAGYENGGNAHKIGNELKNKPAIKIAIDYLTKDRTEKMKVDAFYVLDKIVKSIERAEAKGNETAVLRGAELLARHLGMFVDRQEISGPEGSEIAIVRQREIEQNVANFKSKLARLAERTRAGTVVSLPEPRGD